MTNPHLPRQRRHFYYLSGCDVPDCLLTYTIETSKLNLYIPPIDPDSVIWSGLPLSVDEAKAKYDVDEVDTTDNFPSTSESSPTSICYTHEPLSHDVSALKHFRNIDTSLLKPAIDNCRVTKDAYEVALIRYANHVTALGHAAILRKANSASNERELEAVFVKTCIENACPQQAYHGIIASGTNAATLHYLKNNEPLEGRLNLLVDAAAESNCYAADVTRTTPLSGTFSKESREIYDLVLKMQTECLGMLKADALWDDLHVRAHEIAIEGLISLGILKGNKKEIFEKRISVAFFPHGLGHHLGMDTHDTGGNPNYADEDTMFRYLRIRGTVPEGSVVTVEPGVYFCRFILEPLLKDEEKKGFVDEEVLERYWDVGGVRIEGEFGFAISPLGLI